MFIVLGIVILLLVGLGVYFKDELLSFTGISDELSYPSEIQEVKDHVQECVDISSKNAVIGLGMTGGYFTLPEKSFYFDDSGVAYYYYDGENLVISLDRMEGELNDYVNILLLGCLDIEQFSMDIQNSGLSVESSINDGSVDVSVDYPLIISVGENTYNLVEPYTTSLDVDLLKMNTISNNIVRNDIDNPDQLDLNFLLGQGLSNIEYVPYDNDTIIYVLKDSSSFNGEGYTFMFASYFPYDGNMTYEQYWESWL